MSSERGRNGTYRLLGIRRKAPARVLLVALCVGFVASGLGAVLGGPGVTDGVDRAPTATAGSTPVPGLASAGGSQPIGLGSADNATDAVGDTVDDAAETVDGNTDGSTDGADAGTATPSAEDTSTPTETKTPTETATPTETVTPSASATPTPTAADDGSLADDVERMVNDVTDGVLTATATSTETATPTATPAPPEGEKGAETTVTGGDEATIESETDAVEGGSDTTDAEGDTIGGTVGETVDETTEQVGKTVNGTTDGVGETVNGTTEEVTDSANGTTDAVTETTNETTGSVAHAVNETTDPVTGAVNETTDGVAETTNETTDAVNATVNDTAGAVGDAVDETTDGANDTVGGVTGSVENTTDQVESAVDDASDTTESTVNGTAGGGLAGTVTGAVDGTTDAVSDTTEDVTGTTDDTVDTVGSLVDGTVSATTGTVEETVTGVTSAVDGTVGAATADLAVETPSGVAHGSPGFRVGDPTDGRPAAGDDATPARWSESTDGAASAPGADGGGTLPAPTDPAGMAFIGLAAIAAGAAARSSRVAGGILAANPGAVKTQVQTAVGAARAKLPRGLPIPGYSRYNTSDPLEHDQRAELYETVCESPGLNLTTLVDRTETSRSTARYHLRVLEREGLVAPTKVWGKRRLYPVGVDDVECQAALRDDTTRSVVEAIASREPASGTDLASVLDCDASTVTHHLKRLDEAGLVERERDGRAIVNSLSADARDALGQDAPEPVDGEAAAVTASD